MDNNSIVNHPNLYNDNIRYILDLMLKVIEVSVRSVDLIAKLPKIEIIEKIILYSLVRPNRTSESLF